MKNLLVRGAPARPHTLNGRTIHLDATVHLEHYASEGPHDVYASHSYHLSPADARALAAELLAAADKADGIAPAQSEPAKAVAP